MNEMDDSVEQIFQEAAEIACPNERASFLDDVCASDPQLRRELEDLLRHDDQAQSFLDDPAVASMPPIDGASICESPGTVIGPYTLKEQIGEGAFGLVFVAEQRHPVSRKVALKIIKPGMDTKEVIARFEVERQALALMAHPNICQVFDAGATESGRPYFVMELVRGLPITDYCDREGVSTRERLELFVSVCRAVQHAHSKAVIHRDLKPSNILVCPHDGLPVVKVIDFGIAKAIDHKLSDATVYTQFSQMLGTPLYMSPEQAEINALDVDTRSDVYSLGVLLYELLTGTTPFERDRFSTATYDEIRRLIREEVPPKPSTRLSSVNATRPTNSAQRTTEPVQLLALLKGELDWLVMKSLEKDRRRRYDSANALADDIERYLRNEPVLARPASSLYRIRKFTHRNRLLVASVVAIIVALTVGLSIATFGLLTANQRLAELTAEQENNRVLLRLFRDMYGIPWGMETYGRQLTVRASVDDLSDGLEERFQGDPKTEIEIRQIFANTYRNTGELEKARDHLQLALATAKAAYGPEHEKVADILTDLAAEVDTRNNTIDYAIARDYAEQALAIYDRLGIETGRTAHAWLCLARSIQSDPAVLNETDECLRTALGISRDLSDGKDTAKKAFALWDLGIHLARTGKEHEVARFDEAEELIQEAVQVSRRLSGDHRTLTATVLAAQGECLRCRGDAGGAITSYQKAWGIYQSADLENEPRGHRIAMDLAEVYFATSRHRKAHETLSNLESICREHATWESLTECLCRQGWGHLIREDYGSAETCLRTSVATAEKYLSYPSGTAAYSHLYLGRTLISLGQIEEARSQLEKVVDLTQLLLPSEETRELEIVLYGHAWSLLQCCGTDDDVKVTEALEVATLGQTQSAEWQRTWQEPHFFLVMADAERRLGRVGPAIALLQEGLAKCDAFPSLHAYQLDVPTSRRELEVSLAEYYADRGRTGDEERALRVFVGGVEARLRHFPPDHLQVALAELRLGAFLREQGETDRARMLLQSVEEKLIRNPEAAKANLGQVRKQLELLK